MSLPPLAFVSGALVGSFLNVVIHRIPRGESIVSPRSRCPSCGTLISAWNNIPILSWLFLRGRCASCRAAISIRYPMIELLTAFLWMAVVSRFGGTLAALAGVVLVSGLVVVTFVDLDIWEIPDEVTYPGIVIGSVLRPWAFGTPGVTACWGPSRESRCSAAYAGRSCVSAVSKAWDSATSS